MHARALVEHALALERTEHVHALVLKAHAEALRERDAELAELRAAARAATSPAKVLLADPPVSANDAAVYIELLHAHVQALKVALTAADQRCTLLEEHLACPARRSVAHAAARSCRKTTEANKGTAAERAAAASIGGGRPRSFSESTGGAVTQKSLGVLGLLGSDSAALLRGAAGVGGGELRDALAMPVTSFADAMLHAEAVRASPPPRTPELTTFRRLAASNGEAKDASPTVRDLIDALRRTDLARAPSHSPPMPRSPFDILQSSAERRHFSPMSPPEAFGDALLPSPTANPSSRLRSFEALSQRFGAPPSQSAIARRVGATFAPSRPGKRAALVPDQFDSTHAAPVAYSNFDLAAKAPTALSPSLLNAYSYDKLFMSTLAVTPELVRAECASRGPDPTPPPWVAPNPIARAKRSLAGLIH